jgi:transposase-like protein
VVQRVVVEWTKRKQESKTMPICPKCGSSQVIKNGHIHNGKPKYACKGCGRQFVESPQEYRISEDTKALVDKLLLERLSLAGIVRATGVSARWLQYYINDKYANVPQIADVPAQKKGA